ncbi:MULTISPECIES: AAA family ATPase [unclassified Nocardioides]|uniref:AAA family ATPase n=1 Tax=unclassified Nocardioides TaxID=2615069 RepID=UPI001910EEE0|nr:MULTISPECIES: LuxR family transcriptional regulator [unclassified Nocardioides]
MTHVVADHTLLGRDDELRRVAIVVGNARNGRGGSLSIAGDPGIGKTSLLTAATTGLTGVLLVSVDGYEAESTMPFAAIQRLVLPLRDHLAELPERYQQALRVASGAVSGAPPDRFLVGLSVLGLLGMVGQSVPVVAVVDDAHLLDPESLDALAFVGRRLEAESAALLFAGRDLPEYAAQMAGVDSLRLAGLPADAAIRLLTRSLSEEIDPAVAIQVATATGGNPLALVDLADELTVGQLTESSLGEEPVPIGRHLESFYLRQVRLLGEDVRLWLLVAAADSTGDLDLISSAAHELSLSPEAADGAEAAGLVELGRTVRFRHPLVRSASYNAAHGRDRRRVHRALAAIADKTGLTELGAWHAAKATLGTDEVVAQRLEDVADLAAERGGYASRARVLVQASALTPPGPRKYARLVSAAEAALAAGTAQLAKTLIDEIDEDALDPVSRGRLAMLGAEHALFTADPSVVHGCATLLDAAALFHGEADDLEQRALLKAWECALPSERLTVGVAWTDFGERLGRGADVREGAAATILRALSALVLRSYDEAVPAMRDAVAAFDAMDAEDMLAFGHSSIALTTALWDLEARHRFLERWAAAARDAGSLQQVDNALWVLSLTETVGGTPRRAVRYMEQVRELRRAIGYDAEHVVNVAVLAWSTATRDQVLALTEMIHAMGFGGVQGSAMAALATVDLADGQYDAAYTKLKPFVDDPFFHVTQMMWPDFAEAAVRSGHAAEAQEVADQLESRARVNGSPWARGVAARTRALVCEDAEAEPHFAEALALLAGTRAEVDLGRAHLTYGEWLRRRKRRKDARAQLHAAAEVFAGTGAAPFVERGCRELEAAGEPARAATDGHLPLLTPQERTVAELAAAGRTNAEIGATMFLSPNTVDYHLRKVFQKLAISSRRQLADRLGQAT